MLYNTESWNLYFIIKKHMTKLVRWLPFRSFKLASTSLFSLVWFLRLLHIVFSLHSLQYLIFVGLLNPLSNDFFKFLVNNADTFLPSIILKYWERSNNRWLWLNPLNVLCSCIIPYLSIVRQYFILGRRSRP